MSNMLGTTKPPGWIGGFAQSNPAFSYPDPDLSSLPLLDNMDNIGLLDRQMGAEWPEFSWETVLETASSRCFQMFAPYISRVGYTNEGRIYSIICPQLGIWIPNVCTLNIEVTVTGQRGWVDETTKEIAADMTVEVKLWFTPAAMQTPFIKFLWQAFESCDLPFPSEKVKAIRVTTCLPGRTDQPVFPVRDGQTSLFKSPSFAIHNEAWTVVNVQVQVGPAKKLNIELVDGFNQLVLDLANLSSGNMLQNGNLLSWNVWLKEPGLVNKEEWITHAQRWRESIDVDHVGPTGPGTLPRYFDGTYFNPKQELIDKKVDEIVNLIVKYTSLKQAV